MKVNLSMPITHQIVNRTSRQGQPLTYGSTWGEKVAKARMTSYALQFQIGRKLA
jgi:hypothetical protein